MTAHERILDVRDQKLVSVVCRMFWITICVSVTHSSQSRKRKELLWKKESRNEYILIDRSNGERLAQGVRSSMRHFV